MTESTEHSFVTHMTCPGVCQIQASSQWLLQESPARLLLHKKEKIGEKADNDGDVEVFGGMWTKCGTSVEQA